MKAATKARAAFAACLVLTLSGLALALSLLEFSETAGRVDPSPVASIEQEADDPFPAVDWDYWKRRHRLDYRPRNRDRPANLPGACV